MPSREEDIRYLQDGADEIERFLIAGGTFGTAAGRLGAPLSRLSLGGLLLVQKILSGFNLSPAQRSQVEAANQQITSAREHWRTHWEHKAAQELLERLSLWASFINDYFLDPPGYYRDYSQRVQWRVMLQLLENETESPHQDAQKRIADLDDRVRSAFIPGGFIWESEIAEAFPAGEFWFLFGSIRATRS